MSEHLFRVKLFLSKFYYGWVIVAACTLMIIVTYGLVVQL